MWIYCSWLKFPLRFSIYWGFFFALVFTMMVSHWWHSNSILPSTFISCHSAFYHKQVLSPSPPLIYLFYYWYGFMGFHFFNGLYSLLYLITLMLKLSQVWQVGDLSSYSLCPCDMPPWFFFFRTSLLSGIIRCCRFILYLPCPALKSAISLNSPGFF